MKSKTPKHLIEAHRLICGHAKLLKKNHSKAEFNHLAEVRKIFEDRNIVGLGIAEKTTGGKPVGEMSLCFYVEKKYPKRRLRTHHLIPPVIRIGDDKAIFTDVHEIGVVRAQSNVKRTPLQSGFSVSNLEANGPGTLGALVRDDSGDLYILSNSHVLALSGNASSGSLVIYPGKTDSSSGNEQAIATLSESVHLTTTTNFVNEADAAIAAVDGSFSNQLNFSIFGVTGTPTVDDPVKDRKIVALGRTSGPMSSVIRDANCSVLIDIPGRGKIGFAHQVRCDLYSQSGDSGAIVVDKDSGRIVGLHVGASDSDSIFTPIKTVLGKLSTKVRFVRS